MWPIDPANARPAVPQPGLRTSLLLEFEKSGRKVRRSEEEGLFAFFAFVEDAAPGKAEQVSPSCLIHDAMALLVAGKGVAVTGMLERMPYDLRLTVIEEIESAHVRFHLAHPPLPPTTCCGY